MKTITLLSAFLCVSTALASETNSVVIKLGDKIGDHSKNMEKYSKVEQPRDNPFGTHPSETVVWKVGKGLLRVTHSIGVGIITDMNYAVPSDGEKKTTLKVKQFNPKTGELTIIVPNKELKATGKPAP